MNNQFRVCLQRRNLGIRARLGQLVPKRISDAHSRWKNADEGWKRNRRVIATSFFTVGYFSGLFAYWSCLPERPELPPPDDPETGLYSQSTIVGFTRPQYYEWDHQTNSMMGQLPMWPNIYREFVARKRFWALIKDFPDGWRQLGSQVKQWFEEVSVPEYGLPPTEDNRITVSFELSCLIDAQYNVDVGWQFRLRPGAKNFLRQLSAADCELILYTNRSYHDLQGFTDVLAMKTNNLLNLKDGCNVRSLGVNYKLYRNSCNYDIATFTWSKSLTDLNRNLDRLIHVDLSPREFGSKNRENCIFIEQPDGTELSLNEVTQHILDLIEHNPADCRDYI